jgi:hypothetical protein
MSSNALFAGTDLNGVWRRSISEILESMNAYRQVGIVNQSYFKIGPLSHNGSLFAIEFGISRSDQVTIAMYNLAGRKMPESINQHLNAGSYQFIMDMRAFARGCYVVRMQAGEFTSVQIVH